MSGLSLSLLGSFAAVLNERPLIEFRTNRVRALLSYLATEGALGSRSHRRERLMDLLWPGMPQKSAQANLRQTLYHLRKAVPEMPAADDGEPIPFLLSDRQSVEINPAYPVKLDVADFSALLNGPQDQWPQAVDLYRGDFLADFYLPDAETFEEWAAARRAAFQRQVLDALASLSTINMEQGAWEEAKRYARRQLEIDDLRESAYQQLMRALASDGQRSEALTLYEQCRRLLQAELGIEPSARTQTLYRAIHAGELEAAGQGAGWLRGYQLKGQIGVDDFGAIYRAFQPSVGREVAIKIILPKYANDPKFIRRFEAQARLIARLEHPRIVPLYDYWREPDSAYLVMRWMRGGSLKHSLAEKRWEAEAAVQLVEQIAAALSTAHQQGIVHQDLKPSNILLDEKGNAYLSGFGIATGLTHTRALRFSEGDGETGVMLGSPSYVSPEQVLDGPVTPLSDLYSLGVILYELLTGRQPFPDETPTELLYKHAHEPLPLVHPQWPEIPQAVDDVIQKATAKKPQDRFPDAVALAAALGKALVAEPPTQVEPRLDIINPYKGLRAFTEADADNFFGREALTERLVARLAFAPTPALPFAGGESEKGGRFLAVVGPSGSGKSSVVRAGLVPALRRGALPGSENWFTVDMLPGPHPFEELEAALLRIAINPPPSLLEQLRADERGLLRAVKRVLPRAENSELVLIIDQFEEVFTLVDDPAVRTHFLDSVLAAVTDPRSPVRIIITLRADLYDRPLMYPDFGELVRQRTEVVVPLTVEEQAQAIRRPAERLGMHLETGLVTTIVAELSEQPGALPLLQYALTELFERRQGRVLTSAAYQEIGGVLGALGRRAEEVYSGLDAAGQEVTRQLFLRLITLGEGSGDSVSAPDTRRRVTRAELEALQTWELSESSEVLDRVIEQYGRYRLLTFDRDPLTREPTVEVAHEALLREWRRLCEWLDRYRADVRLQRVLANAAAEWVGAERDASFLLRGSRLDQFEGWAAGTELALTADERAFLEASTIERRRLDEARRAQQARELALERSAVRRLRVIVGVLLVASVMGIMLTFAVFRQSQAAQRQARLATARELAAAALNNLEVDPERSVLLALEAVDVTYAEDGTVLPEVEAVLHRAVPASHLLHTLSGGSKASISALDWVTVVAFSPDGKRVVSIHAGAPGITIRDATTYESLVPLRPAGVVWGLSDGTPIVTPHDIAFSPDGLRLATSDDQQTLHVYDATTGEQLLKLAGGHTGRLNRLNFSPDGTRLATSSQDGTAVVWDLGSRQPLLTLRGHSGPVRDVVFSPDGTRLITVGDDATAQIWDISSALNTGATSAEKLLTLSGHSGTIWGVAISPDGTHLVTGSADATAIVWDMATGQELLSLTGHRDGISDVAISTDGTRLATASADGTAKVWDVTSGRELLSLVGHTDQVYSVAFSPDGTRLATGSLDRTVKFWDIIPDREPLSFASGTVYDMALSPECASPPDGAPERCWMRLATSSARGTATVWDITGAVTAEEWLTVSDNGHTGPLSVVEFSEDRSRVAPGVAFGLSGTRLATAGSDGTARVWDAATGQLLLTLSGHTDEVNGIAFSADGGLLATASEDNTAKIWDISSALNTGAVTGAELFTLSGHVEWIRHVVFSPDGTRLVTASSDDTAMIWDVATGAKLRTLSGHTDRVTYAAFSPDGAYLATASGDGTARVWDPDTGEELLTLSGHTNAVNGIAYSRDGSRIATASADGTTRIWDAESGEEQLAISTHPVGVGRVAFSYDGTRLITANYDNTVRVYVLDIEELMELARQRVTRALTDEECRQYLHVDACPAKRAE